MATLTLSDILDDIQIAEQGLRKFERRYWISSDDFYDLYAHGLLDNGENGEDFAEWAGHYKLRQKRLSALKEISSKRVKTLQKKEGKTINLAPAEPVLEI
ncbi:MAG: hypothetical protein MAG431_02103 [Chloroflexi bacterium]|nr:hypothetical protein [Chloroflexota bacterium]